MPDADREFHNSLFGRISSLFRRKSSLFGCLGNSVKKANRYGWLERLTEPTKGPRIAKFPVFSLDNSELAAENSSLVTGSTATLARQPVLQNRGRVNLDSITRANSEGGFGLGIFRFPAKVFSTALLSLNLRTRAN